MHVLPIFINNCDNEETISHLLVECTIAKNIWTEISQWLKRISNSEVYLDINDILLGNPRNELVTNCIILIVNTR